MVKHSPQVELKDKEEKILIDNTHAGTYHEVKTLLAWEAPGRPFKKRTRTYFATSLLIMLFVEIILFLFSEYMLMLVVLSLVFLAFAFATVPPHNFKYRISSEGVFIEDHFSLWQELYDFYSASQNGQEIVIIRTKSLFPGEITLVVSEEASLNKIKSVLLPYLPYREFIKPTFTEKAGTWLTKSFPLEPVSSQTPNRKVA